MMSIEDNEMAIMNLGTTVGDNTSRIDDLETKTAANMMDLMDLGSMVDMIDSSVMTLEDAALIEDYFFVNPDNMMIPSQAEEVLVDPFCVEGDTVFDFRLALTIFAPDVAVNNNLLNFRLNLLIDGDIVASARVHDNE